MTSKRCGLSVPRVLLPLPEDDILSYRAQLTICIATAGGSSPSHSDGQNMMFPRRRCSDSHASAAAQNLGHSNWAASLAVYVLSICGDATMRRGPPDLGVPCLYVPRDLSSFDKTRHIGPTIVCPRRPDICFGVVRPPRGERFQRTITAYTCRQNLLPTIVTDCTY